ncbi:MAG: hypothetical protein ABH849_03685 [Nanoarchaeota archaeon]
MKTENIRWIGWDYFENRVHFLIKQIKEYEKKENIQFTNIYGIPRGGLYLAVRLSYLLKKKLVTSKDEICKHTLIVDDCTNTGKTLSEYFNDNLKTVTLVHRIKSEIEPTFYGLTTEEKVNYFWEGESEIN